MNILTNKLLAKVVRLAYKQLDVPIQSFKKKCYIVRYRHVVSQMLIVKVFIIQQNVDYLCYITMLCYCIFKAIMCDILPAESVSNFKIKLQQLLVII